MPHPLDSLPIDPNPWLGLTPLSGGGGERFIARRNRQNRGVAVSIRVHLNRQGSSLGVLAALLLVVFVLPAYAAAADDAIEELPEIAGPTVVYDSQLVIDGAVYEIGPEGSLIPVTIRSLSLGETSRLLSLLTQPQLRRSRLYRLDTQDHSRMTTVASISRTIMN